MPDYRRKDHFHKRAKREGVRSRAFYKLEELQKAHKLLKPGQRVIDLGCWPGGWLQAAAPIVTKGGGVLVGVDIAAIDPPLELAGVQTLEGDFSRASVIQELGERVGGPVDVVLSDAAPKLTGLRDVDRAAEEALLEAVECVIHASLRQGGDALIKILESSEAQAIDRRLRKSFSKAKTVKPAATRKGSRERYLLARGWKG